jgi:long-chain acyl-CoA synthetase
MAENFAPIAARKPEQAALVDERRTVTWLEFDAHVNQLIGVLRAAGLGVGDTVGVLCGNRVELFEVLAATMHAGIVVVPLNWHWVADEIAYVLADADARALIVDPAFVGVAGDAVRGLDQDLVVITVGDDEYRARLAAQLATEPDGQALAGPMFYTSGTTGRPKGVRNSLTQAGLPASTWQLVATGAVAQLGLPTEGVTLLCGPAYHSAQWAFAMLPLLAGGSIVMRHHFDAAETLELIDRHEVTNVHLVPTQLTRLLRLPDDTRARFSGESLRVVYHGAAPCPPEVKRRMIDWWGPKLVEYYGGTEGAMLSTIDSTDWLAHPTSVGKPWPTVQVLVLHEDGSPCAVGEEGTLYVRNLLGMDFEYHRDEAKTAAAHREPGVFTLGDIGYLDADGYLHLSDRKIDLIISGGVNIYPAEIEGVIQAHPAVRDVAVFGIPNDEFGEEVKAAVELEPGHEASPAFVAELLAHCRENLAGYKVPRSIDFEPELPRSPTGKLYKRVLRDAYWRDTGRRI